MPILFDRIRASMFVGCVSALLTRGHALQLQAMQRKFLGRLVSSAPLLPGAHEVAFVDVDSTHKRVYGRGKQGVQVGRFEGIRILRPLLATVCTPITRPAITA
ncbi:hypothetical protein E1265_28015 [Streptomyces sp. 8K308]|uniref:hypothetical protein n=1 Tax=Streptomyces sp. 8K308 TaxID=2530388 RepID=UPI001052B0E3|nr:hypothetical protein [Streptomyces sp. 8K308]TDC13425.1 hypothetical protein E1265_28015 [Streptomyces sp. 8K308]